jgi:alkylhydroperoxidase family enzyme
VSERATRYREIAVRRALKGPGSSRPEARLAAFENQGTEASVRALVDKIARRAWTVTDADVEAAQAAGVSEDEIFELTVCAAYGQATRQLNAALAALDEASSAFDTHERIDSGVAR